MAKRRQSLKYEVREKDGSNIAVQVPQDSTLSAAEAKRLLRKTPKPSDTQRQALQRMAAADGTIRRLSGGFWMSGTILTQQYPTLNGSTGQWCDIRTVRAMET